MPVEEYGLAHLRDAVAMVLQKNTLFSGSLRENLLWGNPEAPDEELLRAWRIARVDEFLDRLENGFDTEMGQGGSNISGGQKQRICIARAILKKPKILILDDSTIAVDTATEAEIQKRLREELPHKNSKAILVLEKGKIIERGDHQELLEEKGRYYQLYTGAFELE